VTDTAGWYARAADELAQTSELQVEWARGVAGDAELLALIDELPREQRQPSLLFSVARWCGAPGVGYPEWRVWVLAHWHSLARAAAGRRTQTNEVGRCIPLLLGLDRLAASHAGPFALLELGASAGLCLGVDRYSYRFDDGAVLGAGDLLLSTTTSGEGTAPSRMPDIAWRAGIDLAPLQLGDPQDVRWLEALLPPDRPARLARLRSAIATMSVDPPLIVAGDALAALHGLAATVPPGLTLVVASLGTAVYLPPADRLALPDAVAGLGGHLIAFEPTAAIPRVADRLAGRAAPEPSPFVLSLDGEPLAHAGPHGDRVSWLSAGHPELAAPRT
jgi:hypothetical protein